MRSFHYSAIRDQKWDSEVLGLIAGIYKEVGKQELYLKQRPEELENFEDGMALVEIKLPAFEMVRRASQNKIGRFNKQDIRELCPTLSASSIEGALRKPVASGELKKEGKIKEKFECIRSEIDEQIVYSQLDGNERAVWCLLLASGYQKVLSFENYRDIPEGTNPKFLFDI